MEPGLKETAFFDPVNFYTGETTIVQFTAVDNFGTIINLMIVEGQVHGGFAQGIGQALHEQVVYDGDGQLLTGSYVDYQRPRAEDLPFSTLEQAASA
jgi:carbon-monoxide dehydrogenase large subunit